MSKKRENGKKEKEMGGENGGGIEGERRRRGERR